MITASIIIALILLFYLLGRAADLTIHHIRLVAERLGIKIFFLGVLLGLFTSLPEIAISINSAIDDVMPIAVGNLLGGIVVLFSLILGLSAILNRKIVATEKIFSLFLIFLYILLPLFFSLDHSLGFLEGLVLVLLYFCLLFYLYWQHRSQATSGGIVIRQRQVLLDVFLVIFGLTLILLLSNIIIRLTQVLLSQWTISPFIVGLLLFSLGTNLPEIIVTFRSWRQQIKDLSLSNLLGSGMANPLILGILAFSRPLTITADFSFYLLLFFVLAIFALILVFYRTGRRLTQNEGVVLVVAYILFITSQAILLILSVINL
ncbi:MAG: hypothetical protein A2744_03025 [Candidatus Buchananbacteria bacterium RIFCSPHIGHO2_01_FULL_44_11]|uniref:Sodium/calcium exchanger membrane region domain-containing protein n=1 Tax=Candidatus Buchananbacteria bacterium RIFCSPHIGHO2_01_FULL_44_11 TaxID=1797535 RepID=A0A1G1Y0B8_9BACT|nr:MAG: hypothetical protein A2744_03025 [Candidatus Buchananbacteria bacterium RIFCSPHIGHO2_01_FULL_44_11]